MRNDFARPTNVALIADIESRLAVLQWPACDLDCARKIYAILIASAALLAASCSTIISDESYAMATRGETVQTYSGFGCSEAVLRNATLLALQERGWVVTDTNNPIKARLSELRQEARISIQVKSGVLVVDTKGSLVDGNKAYVPLRYLNYLMASVRKNVLRASAAN